MSDLIVGAWRNGLEDRQTVDLVEVEKRHKQGFKMMPLEYLLLQLVAYLESYDDLYAEFADGDPEIVFTQDCETV